jgi:hypothetical protein
MSHIPDMHTCLNPELHLSWLRLARAQLQIVCQAGSRHARDTAPGLRGDEHVAAPQERAREQR